MNGEKLELFKKSLEKHMSALLLASQSYDKAILSLSTAALGFSFAFIKITPPTGHCCILLFTWFFLILSIVFVMASFLMDQLHTAHQIEYHYWRILEEGIKVERPHWTDAWMFPLPILSGVFFLLGITLFTIFVEINIS